MPIFPHILTLKPRVKITGRDSTPNSPVFQGLLTHHGEDVPGIYSYCIVVTAEIDNIVFGLWIFAPIAA